MSDLAVRLQGVGKMYKIFSNRHEQLVDALGLPRFVTKRAETRYRAFWALRDIDLELERGARVGVIGRNGAGKSTLLKLVMGTLAPTEGTIDVDGGVQALIEIGTAFHPEFTGYENIRAALFYEGLRRRAMQEAVRDIEEFTELGEFLSQPLKTYSLGMKTRLAFATATAVLPEILVVDEVLSAGDAFFISKSVERIQRITDSGASMLIVSHSMQQITQLCENAIWLERGRIVMRGKSIDVVKAYERHIRELEDRRIQERNQRRKEGANAGSLERPDVSLVVRFAISGRRDAALDVSVVSLVRDGIPTDRVEVGAPQDVEQSAGSFVVLDDGSGWSSSRKLDGRYARTLTPNGRRALGSLAFGIAHVKDGAKYCLDVDYRRRGDGEVMVEVWEHGALADTTPLADGAAESWSTAQLRLPIAPSEQAREAHRERIGRSHWPGEGSLRITDVQLTDARGDACAVFQPHDRLRLEIVFTPVFEGTYRFLPCVVIYRTDGINISTELGGWSERELEPGQHYRAVMTLEDLNLGDGAYLASAVLYKHFDANLATPPVMFDAIDRSIEFRVLGTPAAITSVFQHPSSWALDEL